MNKNELITAISEKTGYSKKVVEEIVNAHNSTVVDTIASGDKIQLVGFGTYDSSTRAARVAKNPQTGEEIKVPTKRVPKFKPGKAFKEAVENK